MMYRVLLRRGEALREVEWEHADLDSARRRSESLSYVHGDCAVTMDPDARTFTVHGEEHYR